VQASTSGDASHSYGVVKVPQEPARGLPDAFFNSHLHASKLADHLACSNGVPSATLGQMRGPKIVLTFAAGLLGLTTLTGCPEPEPENFGTIRIEISPLNGDLSILNGTTEITATVNYENCLQEFYLTRNTTYTQDGVDGASVFTDWQARLCTDFSDIPACEVTEIKQNLIEANDVYSLAVTYKITDNEPANLAYREIHVGPLPVEAFAGCGDGERPLVELRQPGLIGKNAAGAQIWRISTLPAQNSAVADQGAPLRVEVQEL
jgi:hypothetical protein